MAEEFGTTTDLTDRSPDFPVDPRLLQVDSNPLINTPHWLPAAIILPLAAVIALTFAVVCMLTRASRLFRGRKTVIVTDPAMLSNLHSVNHLAYVDAGRGGGGDVPPPPRSSSRNGKTNPAFDSTTSVVDKDGQSKL